MKHDLFKRVRVLPNIDIIKQWQIKKYANMKEQESDVLEAICGYEGTGKSYLALDLFENWYAHILNEECTEQTLEYYAGNDVDWAKALISAKHKEFYMIAHDEAVNIIYSKDATSKKNKEINRAFKQIRGKKWYHLMLIPQPQRIDREIREDRLKTLYYVFKYKGNRYVAIYPKQHLDMVLAELNRAMESTAKDVTKRPNILDCETYPALICKIPMYKGKLLKFYKPKKSGVMDESVENVAGTILDAREKKDKVSNSPYIREYKTKITARDLEIATKFKKDKMPMKKIMQRYNIKNNASVYHIIKKVENEGIVFN